MCEPIFGRKVLKGWHESLEGLKTTGILFEVTGGVRSVHRKQVAINLHRVFVFLYLNAAIGDIEPMANF